FSMAQKVGLNDNLWSIVIIFTIIQSAFGTYLLASVLGTFPPALLEAAQLDGASRWTILWRVVFPNVRPTLGVLMTFFF
ncbi:ABC transporter permease subunit, partial [Streptococcus anginosus]